MARTIPITEPVQTGSHPMNVKRIILNRAKMGTVYSACLPLVDIRTPRTRQIVITKLMKVPAWAGVMFNAFEASIN